MKEKLNLLEKNSKKIRKIILRTAYNCGEAAHIGGALSIADIMAVLYFKKLNFNSKDKDRFILSKGHGFLALLATLYLKKKINEKDLNLFQTNGSEFIAHPIMNDFKGIESSNGSLGQGLSFGAGLALAYKKKSKKSNIYVLMGDGECYEGAVWEAAITCTETKLDNLVAIVDCNGFQNDGAIGNNMKFLNLFQKWKGFGWNVLKCDGHNLKEILKCLKTRKKGFPTVIIAKTIKGKGVSFMENNNDWHHGRLTKKIFENATKEI